MWSTHTHLRQHTVAQSVTPGRFAAETTTSADPAFRNSAETQPATEFSKHAQLKPRIYHGREKRQIATTREETGEHVHHITVDYDLDDENYILDLRLNEALLPKGYFLRTQANGGHVINRPNRADVEMCHYHGNVRNRPNSWAALSTCNDTLRGVVFDGAEMHYVEHHDGEQRAYKHADYAPLHNRTCGYSGGNHEHEHDHSVLDNEHFNRMLRYKRSTSETLVRGPYNANKQSRYVELVLVVDNRQFKELDENVKVVEQHCKDIANTINALYSPLNIYIALVGVVVWTDFDEIVFSSNGDITLTNFLHYRREKLIKEHPNDNAQLLTKFTFENGVVGKALKGPICTYEYSGGVNTEHSNVLGLVATTVAHEMGHNFGMEHDTNECSCADERCIMAPSSSTVPPTHWSTCSLDYLALAFEHGMDYCLRNKPARLFDSPVCGNGFVEPGEQCDCGLPEHCDNTCCNATACMLYANASCATGECCDLSTCMPKNAGTMCRSADYECDLPEYCTGQSEYCPDDIYKMDTESCDGGKAYCYHGFCRTRSDQCKLLWGNTGKSSDEQCYKMNTKGTRHGNCGYNKLNQSYSRCNDENVLCGMLHCKHLNERLEFGMESVAILSHSFINLKGSIIPCRTAIVDLGLNQVDPGLAPDGAICGEGKMCVNQKCMAVDSLRTSIGGCPNDCNGNGVCNSMGHCHCKNGFAPPDCDYPGPGGSSDSGPAEDPNSHRGFVTAMFIFFLGVVPTIALFSFVVYYMKHNVGGTLTWKKSPATQKSPPKTRSPPFSPESPKKSAEDNHSLLSSENPQDEFFGQFKGYTLTPIKKVPAKTEDKPLGVVRPAPQVPKVAPVKPNVKKVHTVKTPPPPVGNMAAANVSATTSEPPALPPLNPGAHPRPIISSPTLQNSTCTAKELISPLRNAPKVPPSVATIDAAVPHRQAPAPPPQVSPKVEHHPTPHVTFAPSPTQQHSPPPAKEKKTTTLNRIASFLKPEKKPPKTPKSFIEKDLRSVDISGPIPQNERHTPEKPVTRAQSMKATEPLTKPKLQSFGSMRDPSKRPVSMVGSRPKSPPPPAPSVPIATKQDRPQSPPAKNKIQSQYQNQYDDCLTAPLARSESTSPSNDNIYAVIEDSPTSPASLKSPQSPPSKNTSHSTSNESFGLLGEIVNEIQNRNFDSIYSTSTLARKKKEKERALAEANKESGPVYENTQSVSDETESVGTAEGEYSNMNRGYENSASSTSSGYIHPSAVNRPKYENPIVTPKAPTATVEAKPLSTFKKPSTTTITPVRDAPKTSTAQATPTPIVKTTPTQVTRQITPTNLKTRKASPTRPKNTPTATSTPSTVASKPQTSVKPNVAVTKPATSTKPVISGPKGLKTTSNSPDLVSCSTPPKSATQKAPPDVLNNSNAAKKPLQTKKANAKNTPLVATTNGGATNVANGAVSSASAAKGKVFPIKNSNVASLQQKFENKT
ncbi:disintegrin and metalloproteinase domain-containing protein 12-like isoform X2 [Atheta coriaria]|uniref:disintegrin and metalloproteinase domain-containing protein 12-like isoform X2 n=1 Tax=Dalotia coriaria TaxID=877792 RepID=UPI0031F41422